MKETTPYSIPKEPGRWRAIMLAAVVHAVLIGCFWIGIRWQNEQPVGVEAEVWDPTIKAAMPQAGPQAQAEAKPQSKPVQENPEIALVREQKRKLDEQIKLEKQKLAEAKALEKAEVEERKQLETEKKKKLAADKLKQEEKEKATLEKFREENLKRMQEGLAGSGEAVRSQGPSIDSDYANRFAAKIKSNLVFNVPVGLAGNPPVEFEVRLLPDGSVAGIRKLRPSGVPGFDEAVARAIERSQPFPRDKSGTVPSIFIGAHKPKD
jgi:colicin import membrane protein